MEDSDGEGVSELELKVSGCCGEGARPSEEGDCFSIASLAERETSLSGVELGAISRVAQGLGEASSGACERRVRCGVVAAEAMGVREGGVSAEACRCGKAARHCGLGELVGDPNRELADQKTARRVGEAEFPGFLKKLGH